MLPTVKSARPTLSLTAHSVRLGFTSIPLLQGAIPFVFRPTSLTLLPEPAFLVPQAAKPVQAPLTQSVHPAVLAFPWLDPSAYVQAQCLTRECRVTALISLLMRRAQTVGIW